jgi:Protein of unknown function (DUF1592)/Protein of unknown function (DUF1588)/Protein of unknown function (DUF1595)/Protein of unknown function (DUF1587)/Protein of unknown function (DUF1585)
VLLVAFGCVAAPAACAGLTAPSPLSRLSDVVRPGMAGGGSSPLAAGPAPLRRLTREQYANTVRDLLGFTGGVDADLPVDEGAGGFFSNAIAPVTELQLEKYRGAAEQLAWRAVRNLPALVPCDPGDPSCASRFIAQFGRRAYRRPLTAVEQRRYQAIFAEGQAAADFAGGIRLVLEAMLQSIHFLYFCEEVPSAPAGTVVALDPSALASRLSYFLWNSTPDLTLLAAAEAGALDTGDGVAAQAVRMIADRRFRDAATSFHLQWLGVSELEGKEKNKKFHPLWSEELRAAMREETVRFVDHVLRDGDGRLETLLTARFSFLGGPLYALYGIKPAGPVGGWQRVALDPAQRAGLLTQASVMTVHAHWDRSSLVHRGKLIRERLLCEILPPPPPDVNTTLPAADPKVSTRERFEQHRSDVSCARCHRLIDPLGAPFEMYDGIGNFRTMDGPAPVDSEGELRGTRASDGPVRSAVELVERLAGADEVRTCVARQWLRFALGREEVPEEAGSLNRAVQAFRDSGYRIPALLVAITRTDAFRYQKVAP